MPSTKRTSSPLAAAGNCIALGVAAGAAEVVVRFYQDYRSVHALEMVVALIFNMAVLGTACLVVGLLAYTVVQGLGLALPHRGRFSDATATGVATVASLTIVVMLTGGFGFLTSTPLAASLAGAFGLCGAVVLGRKPRSQRSPIISGTARVALVVTWVACAFVSQAALATTLHDVDAWLAPPARQAPATAKTRPNVLLVVLDTLRRDRVGVYGDSELTPQLDAFSKDAIVYTEAFSTAPWTLPTHASLFTGEYPSQHGVSWGHFGLSDAPTTLAEIFASRGYATRGLSNNCLLSRTNGYDRGFDSFMELSYHPKISRWRFALRCGLPSLLARWVGLDADAGYDQGAAMTNWILGQHAHQIAESGKPSFTFVNFYEPHDPYEPPERFREALMTTEQRAAAKEYIQSRDELVTRGCGVHGAVSDEELALLEALYDAEVAYQDERFGELVAMYRDAGLLDNTWIIVLADHGELFGEHGRAYHSAGTHPQLLHVPLMVRPPGGVTRTFVNAPVQPVDIFATLVGVAGANLPAQATGAYALPMTPDEPSPRSVCVAQTFGASLYALSVSQRADMPGDLTRWLHWMTSVYADGYIMEMDAGKPTALYDVDGDPRADHNLIEKRTDIVRSLLNKYEDWKARNTTGDSL